jgi:hypothetical protein
MAQGFYEILGVDPGATGDAVHAAFQDQLAGLVRRLRAARKQGADVTILEGQERALKEAMAVLTDPVRRQRYDAYRRANRAGMPSSAEGMWGLAKDALVDPLAIASLDVLRQTTELNIGNPFTVAPQPRKWAQRPEAPPPPPTAPVAPAASAAPPPPSAPVVAPVVAPAVAPPRPAPAAPQAAPAPDPAIEITEQVEHRPEPRIAAPRVAPPQAAAAPEESAADAPVPTLPPMDDVHTIAGTYGMDGRFLRAVREMRKRTIEDVAEETRISLRYLHALESNDFDSLPAETFVRGYVKELTRALKIQEVDAVEGYLELYRQQRG